MVTRTEPSAADARPIRVNRPKPATDLDALRVDPATLVSGSHATTDGRVTALGLDLAPIAGSALDVERAR